MDIAITLPKSLWEKIVSGEKQIELRKNFPRDFNVNVDKVYVCLKGTEFIAGFFKVLSFAPMLADCVCAYHDIPPKIAVPIKWIDNYVKNSSWVYLWYIDDVVSFDGNGCYRSIFNLKKNPQSFVYL